jgi:hypothetical protein
MKVISRIGNETAISVSSDELTAINNALNESLELIEDWEFSIRMGVSKKEVETLLTEFRDVRRSAES